jgi:hypothetical protein
LVVDIEIPSLLTGQFPQGRAKESLLSPISGHFPGVFVTGREIFLQVSADHSGTNLNGPMKSSPAPINGTFGEKSEMKKAKK